MKKLKLKIRFLFSIITYFLKLTPFQKFENGLLNIINYHYFVNDKSQVTDASLEITFSNFKKQLSIFKRYFLILPKTQDINNFFLKKKQKKITNSIMITVDDADYRFIKAIKIIEKFKVPTIMFAPIGFCLPKNDINGLRSRCLHFAFFKKNFEDKNLKKELSLLFKYILNLKSNELKKYYKSLTKDEENYFLSKKFLSLKNLKELSKNKLITISSHSMSHVPLAYLPNEWLNWEINSSLKYIERCGGNNSYFAYPYGFKGSYNNKVKKLLKKKNVKYGFTTSARMNSKNDDTLELGRTFASNCSNKNYVLGNASGAFSLFDKVLKRL